MHHTHVSTLHIQSKQHEKNTRAREIISGPRLARPSTSTSTSQFAPATFDSSGIAGLVVSFRGCFADVSRGETKRRSELMRRGRKKTAASAAGRAERQKRRPDVIFLRCITLYEEPERAGFIPLLSRRRCRGGGGHYREILQMHPRTRRRFWTLA